MAKEPGNGPAEPAGTPSREPSTAPLPGLRHDTLASHRDLRRHRPRRATVREFTVPATITVPDDATLSDTVYDNAKNYPDTVSFSRRVDGRCVDLPLVCRW